MKFLRLALYPLSLIYGLAVILRNLAYDYGLLRSERFDLPVISVGNLSAGGTGKSPMTEYLVRLLKDNYRLATLSRGYRRETRGFILADRLAGSKEIGDEPAQFKQKFPGITVAVSEDRVEGVRRLAGDHDLIILDDAFQHRALRPGLSILIFDYSKLPDVRLLLPAGNLREPFWGRERADIIVISRTPEDIGSGDRSKALMLADPMEHQQVFFSSLAYADLQPLNNGHRQAALRDLPARTGVVLLTGIANPGPLLSELRKYGFSIDHHRYPDHHNFSSNNISKLVSAFESCDAAHKVIITTEKDFQRLKTSEAYSRLKELPAYCLPVQAAFNGNDGARFDKAIKDYVSGSTANG